MSDSDLDDLEPDIGLGESQADGFGEVVAAPEAAGERLDRFLSDAFPALSRSRLKILIEKGRVTVNGTLITHVSAKVETGATYAVMIPAPEPAEPEGEDIPLSILFEDAHVLVIDKPAGLSVHPAPGNWSGTLVNAVLFHCGADLAAVGATGRPGIVHRLDKDTSGVMVVCKSAFALGSLGQQFQVRSVDRTYQAFCVGEPKAPFGLNGRIEARLGRDPHNRKKMAVLPAHATAGKSAVTHYKTTARFAPGEGHNGGALASAITCKLETGRTHQVRVHMAHAGAPLIGDPVYGDTRSQRLLQARLPETARLTRQALHAATLAFTHPATSERLSFAAPLPDDMARLEAALRGWA
ncbi:MAG: RluA family pseudouridine synthase [Hyphomonadaceae bacterium]|nr:RluA family pseudouridine synthase [Hyphomonadaceae bacterium]